MFLFVCHFQVSEFRTNQCWIIFWYILSSQLKNSLMNFSSHENDCFWIREKSLFNFSQFLQAFKLRKNYWCIFFIFLIYKFVNSGKINLQYFISISRNYFFHPFRYLKNFTDQKEFARILVTNSLFSDHLKDLFNHKKYTGICSRNLSYWKIWVKSFEA